MPEIIMCSINLFDVFEVSYFFHRNDVGRLQTVNVDIKKISQ